MAAAEQLRAEAGLVDGVAVIALYRAAATLPAYFTRMKWDRDRLVEIRDYCYAPYIAHEARFTRG